MKELPTGEFLVHNPEEYEEAIKQFLADRMIEQWWREKLVEKPKKKQYPCVCRFTVCTASWDIYAIIKPLQEYKDAAEKVWREIEALC